MNARKQGSRLLGGGKAPDRIPASDSAATCRGCGHALHDPDRCEATVRTAYFGPVRCRCESERAESDRSAASVRAGAVDPHSGVKCGWANGYQDCKVPGCAFAAWKTDERCLLVKRERGEA